MNNNTFILDDIDTLTMSLDTAVKEIEPDLTDLEVTPSGETQVFTHEGSDGYDTVTVNAIPGEFVTEDELNEKLAMLNFNVALPTSDLLPIEDNELTIKRYVDDAINNVNIPTKTSELENDSDFTTDTYVDDAVRTLSDSINEQLSSVSSDIHLISTSSNPAYNNSYQNLSTDCYDGFKTVIEKYYGTEKQPLIIFKTAKYDSNGNLSGRIFLPSCTMFDTYAKFHGFAIKPGRDGGMQYIDYVQLWVHYTLSDGVCTISKVQLNGNHHNILVCDNRWQYEPTEDYNPATKKYVDDSIATAITTVLEGEY